MLKYYQVVLVLCVSATRCSDLGGPKATPNPLIVAAKATLQAGELKGQGFSDRSKIPVLLEATWKIVQELPTEDREMASAIVSKMLEIVKSLKKGDAAESLANLQKLFSKLMDTFAPKVVGSITADMIGSDLSALIRTLPDESFQKVLKGYVDHLSNNKDEAQKLVMDIVKKDPAFVAKVLVKGGTAIASTVYGALTYANMEKICNAKSAAADNLKALQHGISVLRSTTAAEMGKLAWATCGRLWKWGLSAAEKANALTTKEIEEFVSEIGASLSLNEVKMLLPTEVGVKLEEEEAKLLESKNVGGITVEETELLKKIIGMLVPADIEKIKLAIMDKKQAEALLLNEIKKIKPKIIIDESFRVILAALDEGIKSASAEEKILVEDKKSDSEIPENELGSTFNFTGPVLEDVSGLVVKIIQTALDTNKRAKLIQEFVDKIPISILKPIVSEMYGFEMGRILLAQNLTLPELKTLFGESATRMSATEIGSMLIGLYIKHYRSFGSLVVGAGTNAAMKAMTPSQLKAFGQNIKGLGEKFPGAKDMMAELEKVYAPPESESKLAEPQKSSWGFGLGGYLSGGKG